MEPRVHSYVFVLRTITLNYHVHTYVCMYVHYPRYIVPLSRHTRIGIHLYTEFRDPRASFRASLLLDSLFTAFYYVMDLKLREVRIGATAPRRRTIVESRMESLYFFVLSRIGAIYTNIRWLN